MSVLLGESPAVAGLRDSIRHAASSVTVLILGERGAGKTVAAEAIHAASGRRGRYIRLRTAGFSRSLEYAVRGTLHIEEVADLPEEEQRLLVDHADAETAIVCSTRERSWDLFMSNRFNVRLLHRLSNCIVVVPPLRDRGADIALLAATFGGVAPEVLALLPFHRWPGNVRELKEFCIAPPADADGAIARLGLSPDPQGRLWNLLRELKGDTAQAALRLGIGRRTLCRRMEELVIPRGAGRCG